MKKKIICIGIISVLLLTGLSSFNAVAIGIKSDMKNKTTDEGDDSVTVTVHTFLDNKIENDVQDSGEQDAPHIYVFVAYDLIPFHWSKDFVGKTDEHGYLTFEVPADWGINVAARQRWAWVAPNQYKGYVMCYGGLDVYDGMHIEIPLKYVETESKSTIAINLLLEIILDRFPLLQHLFRL